MRCWAPADTTYGSRNRHRPKSPGLGKSLTVALSDPFVELCLFIDGNDPEEKETLMMQEGRAWMGDENSRRVTSLEISGLRTWPPIP